MAADKITEIVDQSAFEQVEKLKKDMTTLAATFVEVFKQANAFNDALKGAKGIPEFKAQAAGASKATNELDRVLNELSKTRERLSISENRWTQALAESRLALQQINQETKDSVKLNLAADGSINQMRLQLKSLQGQYDALGKSQREAIGPGMLANIQKTDAELKKLEFSTGRFQRNVGNYASGFNALNSSIAQLTREAPAFANSINTGFMAISNNLPMLSDAIKGIRAENKALAAEGKPTVSVLKQLAAGFFSWQTLLSVGVTLLTVYGGEIIKFFSELGHGVPVIDASTESYNLMNKAVESTDYKNAIKNVTELTDQIKLAKEGVLKKDDVLKNYNDTIGKTVGHAKTLDEAENDLVKHGDAYIQMTLLKAAANAAYDEAGKKAVESEKKRREGAKKILDGIDSEGDVKVGGWQSIKLLFTQGLSGSDEDKLEKDIANQVSKIDEEKTEFEKIAEDFAKSAAKISTGFKGGSTDTESDKSATGKPKDVNRIEDLSQAYDNEIKVTQKKYSELYKTEAEWQQKLLEINYDYAAKKLNGIENLSKKEADSRIDFDDKILKSTTETVDKMAKAVDDQTKKDIDNAKRALKERIDANKERLKDEEDACKDIDAAGEALWKQQKERQDKALEEAKKLNEAKRSLAQSELEFANTIGTLILDAIATRAQREHDKQIEFIDREEKAQLDSLSRRTLTDKQRAEETKKIELSAQSEREKAHRQEVTRLRKAAVYQKALDTASIIASTAIAVMSALGAKPYTPANIALAAGAGIAGATQLARVIAAPLPQYADGTEWHYGGGFIAGEGKDGKGAVELVTTPDGRSFFTPAQATLYPDMPVGTKVKSNEELIQDIYKTAMIKLSNVGPVTTSKMEEAMLASFERYEDKLDTLTDAVRDIKMSATFENFSDHISHVKSRVR